MPQTFDDISNFIAKYDNESSQFDCIWYLKHIKGCRGRQIELFNHIQSLKSYLKSNNKNMKDYIIQKEIKPLLNTDGWKFAIRAHVAIILNNDKYDFNHGFINNALYYEIFSIMILKY